MSKEHLKDKFVQLRIEGKPFEAIAKELAVSKTTLIRWSKESNIKDTITTAKLMRQQKILITYEQNLDSKIEFKAKILQKMKKELEKRDLSKLRVPELVKLITTVENSLNALTPKHEFRDPSILEMPDLSGETFTFNPEE